MKMLDVYVTLEEFSDYIKKKLLAEELAELGDCTFVPIKIGLSNDLCIEALIVAAQNGGTSDRRYRV